jgi:sec-independent protein translocase protein TatA
MGIDNPVHLIFIGVVALIVLGPKRLPELARSLGHGMREFRESMSQAADGGEQTTAPIVSQQAQLVAAPVEPIPATLPDAVVVDPAAPQPMVAGEAVEQPSSSPPSS